MPHAVIGPYLGGGLPFGAAVMNGNHALARTLIDLDADVRLVPNAALNKERSIGSPLFRDAGPDADLFPHDGTGSGGKPSHGDRPERPELPRTDRKVQ